MDAENLIALKDDMVAFIEGHGMRHFPALIPQEMPRIWWNDPEPEHNSGPQDSWKDFVEMAKAVGAAMVCIGEDRLDKETLELLGAELEELASPETFGREMEKLDRLFPHAGRVGHIELAFAHQGVLFVHESVTEWYRDYRELMDTLEGMEELLNSGYEDADEEDA